MRDEQQLASLVLLLRLSSNEEHNDGTTADGSQPLSSPLQKALEENDCNLLLFIGRLIHAYNNSMISRDDDTQIIATPYALLRLAIHVIFLRYTEDYSAIKYCASTNSSHDNRVEECEQYLLRKLLPATLCARASHNVEEVDVEIALIMRCILLRYSQQQGPIILDGKQMNKNSDYCVDLFWVHFVEALMDRRVRRGEGTLQNAATIDALDNDDEERLMVQTIHSILDGGTRSNDDGNAKSSDNNDSDWNLEFNKVIIGCIQSFLQHANSGCDESSFRLKGSTVFGMIQLSQQSDTMSVHAYVLVLQYLQLCIQSSNIAASSFTNCFTSQDIDLNNKESEEAIASSIRSFVFYGLVVLGNTVAASLTNDQQESDTEEAALLAQMSVKELRAKIYTLAVDLWRSFGPAWLFYGSSATSSATSNIEFWWFRSKNTENQLGLTWPLCTLVQLAAGDLRLNLGRWVTIVEDGNIPSKDNEHVWSEIESCATVILETVQLMTSLVDDEGGGIASGVWEPEALLHIRKSLEDALNSSVQYMNSFSSDQNQTRDAVSDQANNVGRICCVLIGTIASELEVEDLLISPSIDERNMQLTKEAETSCFASALSAAMLLCNTVGERDDTNAVPLEKSEPLCCLLPCIMSVTACSTSNERVGTAVSSFPLVYVMSQFLHRLRKRWKHLDRWLQIDESFTILSIIGLCLLIIEELVTSSEPREEYQELVSPLNLWKEALSKDVTNTLEEHVDKTLQQVDDCLIILETYQ